MNRVLLVAPFMAGVLCLHACSSYFKKGETFQESNLSHTSMNALDWVGVYAGNLPCADCEAIQTTLQLKRDLTYVIRTKYSGKSESTYERSGKFQWNERGNKITLMGINVAHFPSEYLVGENTLTQLDLNGRKISGASADLYILRKLPLK